MDDHGDFDSVSWQREDAQQGESSAPFPHQANLPTRSSSGRRSDTLSREQQAGDHADPVDLAGIGRDGILEVSVDTPLKENDGTKDAYVSYLVTTHVSLGMPAEPFWTDILRRQTSRRSRSQISLSVDVSPISYSFDRHCTEIIKPARSLRCPRRTIWHT